MKIVLRLISFCLALWLVFLASILASTTTDYTPPDWSVTLYDYGSHALIELSSDGYYLTRLSNVDRPEPIERWYDSMHFNYSLVHLSNNHRYLVSIIQRSDPYIRDAIIMNRLTGSTITVSLPPLERGEFFVGYQFGAFSPDMSQVALTYVSHGGLGGIVTVDLASGTLIHHLDIYAQYRNSTAWLDNWTSEGIWFAPRCSACTPSYSYEYIIWNPETDSLSPTEIFHHHTQSERLHTGELLFSQSHPDYPLGGPSTRVALNVVSINQSDSDTDEQIVYYSDHNLDFDFRAHWVKNGHAFMVTNHRRRNVIIFRDGHHLHHQYAQPEHFIAMTSEGWLTFDQISHQIRHYTLTDDVITSHVLVQTSGEIDVANVQFSSVPDDLAPFSIDIPPPNTVFCPAALPTRLQAGDWARVLVDHRRVPIAALIVGKGEMLDVFSATDRDNMLMLSEGDLVQVIEGPGCTPAGWSYVKVDYRGVVGWILEVFQTRYYLAPASPPTIE